MLNIANKHLNKGPSVDKQTDEQSLHNTLGSLKCIEILDGIPCAHCQL